MGLEGLVGLEGFRVLGFIGYAKVKLEGLGFITDHCGYLSCV